MSKPNISNPVTAIAEADATGEIADNAYNLITTYTNGVHRIVTIGHTLANWLAIK